MSMEKFYIFLDIDGTLWDREWAEIPYAIEYYCFKPSSVIAVHFLCDELKLRNFEPQIVITSKQREDWEDCQHTLYDNNMPNVPTLKLPIGKHTRGERISLFMYDASKNRNVAKGTRVFSPLDSLHFRYTDKVLNFVVIDDNSSQLGNIPEKHYIKTNIKDGALKKSQVETFLEYLDSKLNPEPEA